ncbi:AAA family ATPase [Micromonospora chokoriensis]
MSSKRRVWNARREQLTRLDGMHAAAASSGRFVLVRGPEGAGRSTLLATAARTWRAAGATVLTANLGDNFEHDAYGFGMLLDVLRTQFDRLDDSQLAAPLADLARACSLAAGRVVERTTALARVLDAAGAYSPVVLLADDADQRSTSALLLAAARRPGCLVVASCRSGDGPNVVQLTATADEVIDLPELSRDEMADLLRRAYGWPADEVLREALWVALGPMAGRPGTVLATLDALDAAGRLATVREHLCLVHPDIPIPLPAGHELVARVRHRGSTAVRLVTAVAAAPITLADLSLLAVAIGGDAHRYGMELDHLVADGVLDTEANGTVRLCCAALGTRLLEDAGATVVARLHRSLAATLLRRISMGETANQEAVTDRLASACDAMPRDDRVAGWLLAHAAATTSKDALRAARWLRSGLRLSCSEATTEQIAGPLIHLLARTGRYTDLREAARAVRGGGSVPQRTVLLAALYTGTLNTTPRGTSQALRDLYDLWCGSVEPDERLGVMAAATRANTRSSAADAELAFPTAPHRTAPPDDAIVRHVVDALCVADVRRVGSRPTVGAVRSEVEEVLAAGSLGDIETVLRPVLGASYGAPAEGVLRTYRRLLDAYAAGQFSGALSAAREMELIAPSDALPRHLSSLIAAEMYGLRGETDLAADCLSAVPDQARYAALRAWVDCGLAEQAGSVSPALVWNGWRAYARQRAAGSRIGVEQLLPRLAELAVYTRQPGLAAQVLAEARELRHGSPRALSAGTMLVVRALVHNDPAAARAGLRMPGQAGSLPGRLSTCVAMARRAHDPVTWLRLALDLARLIDAHPLRTRVAHMLRERGLSVPRLRAAQDEMSDTDRQILVLLRTGRTNYQIAQRLCLSEKTVENRLTRIFARTGHRTRVELVTSRSIDELLKAAS